MFERSSDSLLSLPLAWLEISPVFMYPAVTPNASKLHDVLSPPVYFVFTQYLRLLSRHCQSWWILEAFWGRHTGTWHPAETTCFCTHDLCQAWTQFLISKKLVHWSMAWLYFQVLYTVLKSMLSVSISVFSVSSENSIWRHQGKVEDTELKLMMQRYLWLSVITDSWRHLKDAFCSGHVLCLPESAAIINAI